MEVILAIGLFVFHIIVSISFGGIAAEKGHSTSYGWACFFLGVIGYCWVAALPDLEMRQTLAEINSKLSSVKFPAEIYQSTPEVPSNTPLAEKADPSVEALAPIVSAEKEIVCPVCGTKQMAGRKVCWSCGQKFITQ